MKKNVIIVMMITAMILCMTACGDNADLENQLAVPEKIGGEAQESGNQESEPQESENQESEPQESENQEQELQESGNQESELQESEAQSAAYYGTWEIKDYQFASVAALTTEDADKFISRTVTYGADEIAVDQSPIDLGEIRYEEASISEEDLVRDYKANLGEWWNGKDNVTLVYVDYESDADFFGGCFVLADGETIWIFHEGVFFLAKKVQ